MRKSRKWPKNAYYIQKVRDTPGGARRHTGWEPQL